MRLYLVRHGETVHNDERRIQGPLLDGPLNARGLDQAERLAQWFAGKRVDAIYSSPMRRAMDTAAPLARAVNLPVGTCPGLVEFSWGDLLGKLDVGETRDQLAGALKRWEAGDLDYAVPNGETPKQAWVRAVAELGTIFEAHEDQHVVIVAHGRLNKVILAGLISGDLSKMEAYPQPNAGIAVCEYDGRDWKLVSTIGTEHLHGIGSLEEQAS